MDKARKRTDKRLKSMEKAMGKVYKTDPALVAIKREYKAYMDMVLKRTQPAYVRFVSEKDIGTRNELKRAYQNELETLTVNAPEYQNLIERLVEVLADVNQKALDIANDTMLDIYVDNYNQVATDCKRVGFNVNG